MAVSRKDYDSRVDVVPVSDPNISSNAQRITKAQAVFEMARQAPEQFDMREIMKHVLVNMDYDNVEKLLPEPEQAQPQDPLTDIQLAVNGKPIKAFEGQDHQSHVQLKQAFLSDPYSGGSQLLASARAILEANIQEHLFMQFKEQVQAMGAGGGEAQAAQQVAQMNAQKAQAEAEQAAQQGDKTDEAAMLLAEAEMINAQSDHMKEQFDIKHKIAQYELDKEKLELEKLKEIGKMIALDAKIAGDIEKLIVTKGLDAQLDIMKDSLEIVNSEKMEVLKADLKVNAERSLKATEKILGQSDAKKVEKESKKDDTDK